MFCPNFEKCGGCSLALEGQEYDKYKTDILLKALGEKGLKTQINPLKKVGLKSRRRVSLSYKNFGDNFKLGFKEKQTHFVVNIENCPLLTEGLNKLLKPTYDVIKSITKKGDTGFVNITEADNGFDFVWSPHRVPKIDLDIIEKFQDFAKENGVISITRAGKEVIFISKEPVIKWEDFVIPFPPSAFLQPSKMGEKFLVDETMNFIKKYAKKTEKIADLFSGLGTFSVPLLQFGEVFAYDIFSPSVKNLSDFSKGKIKAVSQNLFDNSLSTDELNEFDLIVLDPPRAGALSQIRNIAKSDVPVVIYISCDPNTFARDAKIMVENGYKLTEITPLDQFPYTDHLEIMASFTK